MRIDLDLRRVARRSAVPLVLTLLLAAPALSWRATSYRRGEQSPIHGDIAWMADNEIAEAFDDGTYRPGNAVTRQAMAAFMRRRNSEFEVVSVTIPSEVNIADDEFTMPPQCPGSKRALAGGGRSSVNELMMTDSYPEPADVPGVPDA